MADLVASLLGKLILVLLGAFAILWSYGSGEW